MKHTRISQRDLLRQIRKDIPPSTRVHKPKKGAPYSRKDFDWRRAGEEEGI